MDKLSTYVGRILYLGFIALILIPFNIPLKSMLNYVAFICIFFMTPYIILTFTTSYQPSESLQEFRQ